MVPVATRRGELIKSLKRFVRHPLINWGSVKIWWKGPLFEEKTRTLMYNSLYFVIGSVFVETLHRLL